MDRYEMVGLSSLVQRTLFEKWSLDFFFISGNEINYSFLVILDTITNMCACAHMHTYTVMLENQVL